MKILIVNSEANIKGKNLKVSVDVKMLKKQFGLNKKNISDLEKIFDQKDLSGIVNKMSEIDVDDLNIKLGKYNIKTK